MEQSKRPAKNRRLVYSVEEVESKDGSVSYEFNTIEEAEARMKEVLAHPGWGVRAVRLWVAMVITEEKIKNPKVSKRYVGSEKA